MTSGTPSERVRVPLYNIPFRCLYSRNVVNLLFAGRNISVSHVALGSTRVMATCAVMGQAVGTAAALCARRKVMPRDLAQESISDLQQQLLKDDAYIIGVSNNDPYDLARKASVRASSQRPDSPADNVINGIHRRVYDNSNCWSSARHLKMPQWVELRFPGIQRLREVHLVFDSDLCERGIARRKRDVARSAMASDYELQVIDGGNLKTVAMVEGNYQRKRIHVFEPADCSGLRLLVHATRGNACVRVFEIRAYS